MTPKPDLIAAISRQAKLDHAPTRRLLVELVRIASRRLLEGKSLTLPRLGTFGLTSYQARKITDITHPNRTLMIPAHQLPAWRASQELRAAIRGVKPIEPVISLAAAARPTNVAFVDLTQSTIPKPMLDLLPEPVLRRYQIMPLADENNRLHLGMVDPENHEAIELVKKVTGRMVTPALITQTDLIKILDRLGGGSAELSELAAEATDDLKAIPEDKKSADEGAEQAALEHAPAAKVMSQLIKRAVREGASDIHIEPANKATDIRIRVDGILRHVATVPRAIHAGLVARVKILTNLRLDEHRLPQDGRFRSLIDHGEIDFRVSILPTIDGEKIVLRILDKSVGIITLDKLGLRGTQFELFEDEIHKSHGMILVTGPTGSGKTTTLYAAIDRLKSIKSNITTLEDPVEYRLDGINQSQVNSEIGYTFAAGLRSILRQDPNIVLVGEIRDTETAEIAVHAALTGHIVLSTLHTNDAAGAIPRLIDMGVEPFLITSSLNAVIAQRLVRQICLKCRQAVTLNLTEYPEIKTELAILKKRTDLIKNSAGITQKLKEPRFYAGRGCVACGQTGYKGRFGIYEILAVTEALKPLITTSTDSAKITTAAIADGMLTLRQDGLLKALNGETTLEEVWRVTKM